MCLDLARVRRSKGLFSPRPDPTLAANAPDMLDVFARCHLPPFVSHGRHLGMTSSRWRGLSLVPQFRLWDVWLAVRVGFSEYVDVIIAGR